MGPLQWALCILSQSYYEVTELFRSAWGWIIVFIPVLWRRKPWSRGNGLPGILSQPSWSVLFSSTRWVDPGCGVEAGQGEGAAFWVGMAQEEANEHLRVSSAKPGS